MLRVTAVVLVALASLAPPLSTIAAQAPTVTQVRGTVFDSVSMTPLRGALVRIVRADDPSVGRSTQSDSLGMYVHDSVTTGVWLASFLHPTLDSLRLEPGIIRLEITEAGVLQMPLGTPSGQTLVAQACGASGDDVGVIFGTIRNADDESPLVGATVEVEWPEWTLGKKTLITERAVRRAVADSLGAYRICGVPSGSTLRARSWVQADSAGLVEVIVPASGYAVQDFDIGLAPMPVAATTNAAPDASSSGEAPAIRRGTAVVRGRISTAAGAPLPDAIVRVVGSGSADRTSATGEFRVADAVAGTQTIEARAIGYSPVRQTVRLRSSGELDVRLTLAPRNVELDTIRVTAGREIPWDVRGIERRWRTGLGAFIDGKTVRERASMYTTDALRGMAGVFIRQANQQYGNQIIMRSNNGTECRALLFVDGMQYDLAGRGGMTIDETISADQVAAVEIYARPTLVPAEYLTMRTGCGVVAVWTKFGTGNVPILPPKSSR